MIRRSIVPALGTEWCDRWQRGELTLLDAHEALAETRILIERLRGPTMLLSDHISNFLDVHGRIPEDRELMLAEIDDALERPIDSFRPATDQLVGLML